MREREEEMERMREHVFKESDTDKDRLISFQEFLAETKREEFEKDPGQSLGVDPTKLWFSLFSDFQWQAFICELIY